MANQIMQSSDNLKRETSHGSNCLGFKYYIQIMSKKPQPQKGENPKTKTQIVDEQNEPFLRALQKKVRNINKKLAEIAELQAKDNLKPEQVEKINRKEALIEERTKAEENALFFKQVYAENPAHYRNNQLRELEILARAISIYHAAPQIPEQPRLSALWNSLQQQGNHANLNAAIASLATSLKDFANDRKIQKSLTNYVQKHGESQIVIVKSAQEQVVNEQKPAKQEVKIQEPQPKFQPVPQPQPTPEVTVVQTKAEPKVQIVPEVPQVVVQQETTPIVQEPTATQDQQPAQNVQGEKRDYRKKDNRDNRDDRDRPYRGKGNYNNNRERREVEGEKRQYKPKYEEKKGQQPEKDHSDSSDSQEESRQFRKEEIKKLEDEGFIVVGKPKPKPKDSHEQQRVHEKQHGKKYHKHHQASNH